MARRVGALTYRRSIRKQYAYGATLMGADCSFPARGSWFWRWITATCFSSLFLALLAAWQLPEGFNVFHEPGGSGVAIRALPDLCLG
jgi:hypothetical protein